MLEPALTWIRSLKDPFRNANAAAQWIDALPTTDAMVLQKEALELVAKFPGARRVAGYAQAEALLRIDARLEPVLVQLAQQYATNYQKSTDVETRLWHAVFDLVKALCGGVCRAADRLPARRPQAVARTAAMDLGPPRPLQGHRRQFRLFTAAGSRRNGAKFRAVRVQRARVAGSATSSRMAPACSPGRACASSRST
jgi:hypothetical protein